MKENGEQRTRKWTDIESSKVRAEIDPFCCKKLDILRQINKNNCSDLKPIPYNTNQSTDKFSSTKPDTNLNGVGCFQSAYERLKFENLRGKYQRLLKSNIHCLQTCKSCERIKDDLLMNEFYKKCVRKLKREIIEAKITEHEQNRTSVILIANIIKDDPKTSWSSDRIWDKILVVGGYQHSRAVSRK